MGLPPACALTATIGGSEAGDLARFFRQLQGFSPEMRACLPASMLKAFDSLDDSKVNLAIDGAFARSGAGNSGSFLLTAPIMALTLA